MRAVDRARMDRHCINFTHIKFFGIGKNTSTCSLWKVIELLKIILSWAEFGKSKSRLIQARYVFESSYGSNHDQKLKNTYLSFWFFIWILCIRDLSLWVYDIFCEFNYRTLTYHFDKCAITVYDFVNKEDCNFPKPGDMFSKTRLDLYNNPGWVFSKPWFYLFKPGLNHFQNTCQSSLIWTGSRLNPGFDSQNQG